jgi:hypothetical protein
MISARQLLLWKAKSNLHRMVLFGHRFVIPGNEKGGKIFGEFCGRYANSK